MSIDKSGEWWKGTGPKDIEAYLKALKPGGYAIDRATQLKCSCGHSTLALTVDSEREGAKSTCSSCGTQSYIADSEEYWDDASPEQCTCPCKGTNYEVMLGLCIREKTWVRWISIGVRCVRCGILSSPADWKSELDLADPVFTPSGA